MPAIIITDPTTMEIRSVSPKKSMPQTMPQMITTALFAKATVSGIYITAVKGLHGTTLVKPTKKKGWFKRNVEKLQEKAGAKPLK